MISINVTLFIQMANFLILLWVLNLILFRPIRNIIKERNQTVASFTNEINSLTNRASEAMKDFEQKLAEARKAGAARAQSIKEEGQQTEAELLEASSREAQAEVEQVRDKIRLEIQQARDQLRDQVQAFSMAVTEKILGRSIQ